MNKYFLVVLLASIVFIAGCQQQAEGPDLSEAYIGGNQGLAMSFAEGMPPAEVSDAGNQEFSVGIMLENVGETTIGVDSNYSFGFIELVGINPTTFGKAQQSDLRVSWEDVELQLGRTRKNFDGSVFAGEQALVQIEQLKYVPDRTGNDDPTIRANVCYEYGTQAQASICIKDNVLERAADDTICTLSGAKSVSNSGAPVQVTQVTQNPAGQDRIQVTFRVANTGQGMVFAPGGDLSLADQGRICDSNAGPNSLRNRVDLSVSLDDDSYNVRCPLLGGSDEGTIQLYGGSPVDISCTLETLGAEGTRMFEDNLLIEMDYTYFEFIETPILIRDVSLGAVE